MEAMNFKTREQAEHAAQAAMRAGFAWATAVAVHPATPADQWRTCVRLADRRKPCGWRYMTEGEAAFAQVVLECYSEIRANTRELAELRGGV